MIERSGLSSEFTQQMLDEANRLGDMVATITLQGDSAMLIQGVLEGYLLGAGHDDFYGENIDGIRNFLRVQLPPERFPTAWRLLERKAPLQQASGEEIETWFEALPLALAPEMLELSKITVHLPIHVQYMLSVIVPLQVMSKRNAVAPETQPLIRSVIRQMRSTLPAWAIGYRRFIDSDWEERPSLLPVRRVSKKERRAARSGALPKKGR